MENSIIIYDTKYHMALWLTNYKNIFAKHFLQAIAMFHCFTFMSLCSVHSMQPFKKKVICTLLLPDDLLVSEIWGVGGSSGVIRTHYILFLNHPEIHSI